MHLDTSAAAGVSAPRDIHIVTLVVHHVKKWEPGGLEEEEGALSLSHLVYIALGLLLLGGGFLGVLFIFNFM